MNSTTRMRMLMRNYIDARLEGERTREWQIEQAADGDFENYYVLMTPQNGVYANSKLLLSIKCTYGGEEKYQFPMNWPLVRFENICYHVNVQPNGGTICLDILKDPSKWSAANSIASVLLNIQQLLEYPNNSSAWNSDASRDWIKSEQVYSRLLKDNHLNDCDDEAKPLRARAFADFSDVVIKKASSTVDPSLRKYFEGIGASHDEVMYLTERWSQVLSTRKTPRADNSAAAATTSVDTAAATSAASATSPAAATAAAPAKKKSWERFKKE
jgi:ubiquitin-protein ligase